MIEGHLNELRSVVEQATDLPEATRAKLLQLTAQLEQDVAGNQDAEVSSEDESASTATDTTSTSLVSAIEGLEASHPEVTATVSNVARMLSKLGF